MPIFLTTPVPISCHLTPIRRAISPPEVLMVTTIYGVISWTACWCCHHPRWYISLAATVRALPFFCRRFRPGLTTQLENDGKKLFSCKSACSHTLIPAAASIMIARMVSHWLAPLPLGPATRGNHGKYRNYNYINSPFFDSPALIDMGTLLYCACLIPVHFIVREPFWMPH